MTRFSLILPAIGTLFGCEDETLTGYGAAEVTWVLTELDDTPFTARATLSFPEEGKLTGQAPCNSFVGEQTVPYPWFKAENVNTTRAACPELDAENVFLEALSEMTLAEVVDNTLILSTEDGRKMVFTNQ